MNSGLNKARRSRISTSGTRSSLSLLAPIGGRKLQLKGNLPFFSSQTAALEPLLRVTLTPVFPARQGKIQKNRGDGSKNCGPENKIDIKSKHRLCAGSARSNAHLRVNTGKLNSGTRSDPDAPLFPDRFGCRAQRAIACACVAPCEAASASCASASSCGAS